MPSSEAVDFYLGFEFDVSGLTFRIWVCRQHAIPHAGTRNDGPDDRLNMIWRIRAKARQPSFIHNGMTDHPDRMGETDIYV